MKIKKIILIILLSIFNSTYSYAGKQGKDIVETPNRTNYQVEFCYYFPDAATENVLVCLDGLGAQGDSFMQGQWKNFADKNGVIILAPSFKFSDTDWVQKQSYQYPDVWSGEALMKMLDKILPDKSYKLYMFGFSAGAQFVHRFALIKPDITKAVYAHAAGGYTFPDERIDTQFMITVGEQDSDRRSKAEMFNRICNEMGIKSELKIYPNQGHGISSVQINDAFSFLQDKLKRE